MTGLASSIATGTFVEVACDYLWLDDGSMASAMCEREAEGAWCWGQRFASGRGRGRQW
jgi:hypothetical protein